MKSIKMKSLLTITTAVLVTTTLFTSCSKKEGCTDPVALNYDAEADDDDGSCLYLPVETDDNTNISLKFTHNFDGDPVSSSTFNQFNYVNLNDDTLSITKLRYLVSKVRLYKSDGDSIVIPGYQLIDVSDANSLTYTLTPEVAQDTYTGIAFSFGFDSLDNIDNAYPDLNVANWNYPIMLGAGGGYHYMQMEGRYKEQGDDSLYAYHHVIARISPGVFENNNVKIDLPGITLNKLNAEIEVEMNVAEWYKNPNTWDLNVFHAKLMPNYTAQKMMQANASTVFSMGTVIQTN